MVPHKCAGIKAKYLLRRACKNPAIWADSVAKLRVLDEATAVRAVCPIAALRPGRYSPRNRIAPLEGANHVQRTA